MIVFGGVVRPEFPSILKRSHCFKFAKICGRYNVVGLSEGNLARIRFKWVACGLR